MSHSIYTGNLPVLDGDHNTVYGDVEIVNGHYCTVYGNITINKGNRTKCSGSVGVDNGANLTKIPHKEKGNLTMTIQSGGSSSSDGTSRSHVVGDIVNAVGVSIGSGNRQFINGREVLDVAGSSDAGDDGDASEDPVTISGDIIDSSNVIIGSGRRLGDGGANVFSGRF